MRKNIVSFMKQHTQEFSITQLTRLFGISRSYYYRHRYKEIDTLSDVELRIQELVTKNHFLYGYRKIHALIGVPSANGEFVSIRRFPLISPVILYNKECFQNNSKNQLDNSGN
ncbi:hypothetical protein [Listeria seeligeri]|uniref:hypothetical protein n=1 Tax=Listeria seeligeri TaxID=1640 RepID=UPI0018879865|nr:hypothetical protein [Listeria seeligeri]MBF2643087.1 hypothetical protein [Listeria seeligeri]